MVHQNPVEEFFGRDTTKLQVGTKINTIVRGYLKQYLDSRGFMEINPVIISPISDPLNHPVRDPTLDYYGHRYRLTKSMIFHKQLALVYFDRVYCFSPNIRMEPLERRFTGRHLAEFTQMDLEVKGKDRDFVIELAEGMVNGAIEAVRTRIDSRNLNKEVRVYHRPFRRIKYMEALAKYGKDFEDKLSEGAKGPFWIIDIPLESREFYDREKEPGSGILNDMDLIYPGGYGEAISGGEREFEYERIIERIKKKNQNPQDFHLLLEAAKRGLPPSAGFGIGIERLVRFLSGIREIEDVVLFPKKIGEFVL